MNTALHLQILPATETGETRDIHLDEKGRTFPGAVAGARRVLVVPGQALVLRRLAPGPATAAQARAAAWHALRGQLATSPEQLAWEVGEPDEDGFRWVAAFDPAFRGQWRTTAGVHGGESVAAVPACLLLPPPTKPGHVRVWNEGGLVHARGDELAFSAEPGLATLLLGGRETEGLGADDPATPWRSAADPRLPDLLASDRSTRERAPVVSSRRLAGLAAAVLLMPAVVLTAQGLRHEIAAACLDEAAQDRLLAVDPAATGPGRPLARAHASLARRVAAQQPAPALAALLQAQANVPDTRLRSLAWGPDGVLEVRWEHPADTPPPRLADALAPLGYSLSVAGSEPAGAFTHSTLLLSEQP